MKILFISDLWLPFPGGAERYMANIADAMVQRGHQVHIFTSYEKAQSDLPLTIVDMGPGYDRGPEQIKDMIQTFQPDILLCHHFFAGRFPEIWEQGLPVVEVIHNRPRNPKNAFAIFNSRYTASRAGWIPGDVIMLPPALPNVVAKTHEEAVLMIKPLKGKGIERVYRLARHFKDTKFVVLRGEWQDCEYIEDIPNVEFLQPVKDIRDFWKRGNVLLMPSLSEDAGTSCQEAALNGIPAISSDVGGLPETNGGVVLGDHDPLWIETLDRLLHDKSFYEGVVARQGDYLGSLDWQGTFNLIEDKMRMVCAK